MRAALLPVVLSLTACEAPPLEAQLTITQGLYGQLTQRCDGEGCVGAPRVGSPVGFFDGSPFARDGGVAPEPRLTTTSSSSGLYEFALDSGTRGYLAIGEPRPGVGIQWFTATAVTIPRGLGRVDWQAGGNEGTWRDVK
jgi:hypothetical protein